MLGALSALALLASMPRADAQLSLTCKITPSVALQFEPIMAEWTLENNTGHILELGTAGANCRIGFDIHDASGLLRPARTQRPLVRPTRLQPSQSVTLTNWIEQAYDMRNTGPYAVQARAEWNGRVYLSNKVFMDIWPGTEIDRVVAGLPGRPGVQRTFILITLNRDKQDRLFLRIDDEHDGICYGVHDLGRLLRTGAPTLKMDGEGMVHVLHRSGPSQYIHSVISADGELKDRKPYTGDYTRIRIEAVEGGKVDVVGTLTPKEELISVPQELPMRRR